MTTLKIKTLLPKDNDWQTISSKPHLEISSHNGQSDYKKNQLLKATPTPAGATSKISARKFGEDIKSGFCKTINIPGKLFEKNKKLLSFTGNINCS